ncbi:hypothetical protein K440DRAFT_662813 [Wilcoxina mikolae CBS 423.85]|nr:hypothetical protein K440DRAFT_662813 [Wilcoxina mikolae CBS 423.85]
MTQTTLESTAIWFHTLQCNFQLWCSIPAAHIMLLGRLARWNPSVTGGLSTNPAGLLDSPPSTAASGYSLCKPTTWNCQTPEYTVIGLSAAILLDEHPRWGLEERESAINPLAMSFACSYLSKISSPSLELYERWSACLFRGLVFPYETPDAVPHTPQAVWHLPQLY